MVALPMTPAAPVTTATLPSSRIRSAMSGVSPRCSGCPGLRWFSRGSAHPRANGTTISSETGHGEIWRLRSCFGTGLIECGRGASRPFRAVFGVLTGAARAADKVHVGARFALEAARCRTIALTGFAALIAASTIRVLPPAQAQIGNTFRSAAAAAGPIPRGNQQQQQLPDDDEEVPELPRGHLLPSPEPSAAGAGRTAAGTLPVAAAGAAAGYNRLLRRTAAGRCRSAAAAGARPGVTNAPPGTAVSPGPAPAQGRAADAGHAAARRRGGDRAAGDQDHQQEGDLLRPRQDHRPHHQFRRGYRRDRAVRRAAGEDQRLLYAGPSTKPPTPTPLSRSTRSRCRAR